MYNFIDTFWPSVTNLVSVKPIFLIVSFQEPSGTKLSGVDFHQNIFKHIKSIYIIYTLIFHTL